MFHYKTANAWNACDKVYTYAFNNLAAFSNKKCVCVCVCSVHAFWLSIFLNKQLLNVINKSLDILLMTLIKCTDIIFQANVSWSYEGSKPPVLFIGFIKAKDFSQFKNNWFV